MAGTSNLCEISTKLNTEYFLNKWVKTNYCIQLLPYTILSITWLEIHKERYYVKTVTHGYMKYFCSK